jgi:hypothetical protein
VSGLRPTRGAVSATVSMNMMVGMRPATLSPPQHLKSCALAYWPTCVREGVRRAFPDAVSARLASRRERVASVAPALSDGAVRSMTDPLRATSTGRFPADARRLRLRSRRPEYAGRTLRAIRPSIAMGHCMNSWLPTHPLTSSHEAYDSSRPGRNLRSREHMVALRLLVAQAAVAMERPCMRSTRWANRPRGERRGAARSCTQRLLSHRAC